MNTALASNTILAVELNEIRRLTVGCKCHYKADAFIGLTLIQDGCSMESHNNPAFLMQVDNDSRNALRRMDYNGIP